MDFSGFSFDVIGFLKNLLKGIIGILVTAGLLNPGLPLINPQPAETDRFFMAGDSVFVRAADEDNRWIVGFSKKITTPPDILENPRDYYLAGYGNNTHPAEVMDDTFVRTVYIDDNSGRGGAVFAVIDAIGLSNREVLEIRESVSSFTAGSRIKSVNVLCTHLHAGVDTQGLWGNPYLLKTGRNARYNEYLKSLVCESIYEAYAARTPGSLYWGDILPETDIFSDNRKPYVYEKSLTRIRFTPASTENDRSDDLYICTFNAHPENMALGNSTLSADFPAYMGRYIAAHTGGKVQPDGTVEGGADFVFVNGAVGALINARGLGVVFDVIQDKVSLFTPADESQTNIEEITAGMKKLLGPTGEKIVNTLDSLAPDDLDTEGKLSDTKKKEIRKSFTQSYGETAGRYICEIDGETEYSIQPFMNIRFRSIILPVENYVLTLGAKAGLVYINSFKAGKYGLDTVITTEAGCLELGNSLRILLAPGELAPENAMGGFLPAEESSGGFAITRKTGFEIINPASGSKEIFRRKSLVFGLVNDEIGYIIPENDFYVHRFLPYAAQENDRLGISHYEETVSTGPKTAGLILDAWQEIYNTTH